MRIECGEFWQAFPLVEREPMNFKNHNNKLILSSEQELYSYGKCVCITELEHKDKIHTMNITYEMKGKNGRIRAYCTFLKEDGETMRRREYFMNERDGVLSMTFKCHEEEAYVKVEICFSCFGHGECVVDVPYFDLCERDTERKVKVATTYFDYRRQGTMEDNFNSVLEIIDRAGQSEDKPDFLCFTETVYDRGVPVSFAEKVVPQDGEYIDILKERAKKYKMYIIFSAHDADENELVYNTAYLISPEGEVAGKYRKTHITMGEYECGMVPGDELPVFDTPFGRIGILICWDQWFPETARILQLKGAEIIFWPTAGYEEIQMLARAYDNALYIVSACAKNPECCTVADPSGQIIERLSDVEKGYMTVEIDLGKKYYQPWLSVGDANGCGKDVYPNERRTELYEQLIGGYRIKSII